MRLRAENTRETEITSAQEALGRLFCSRFGAANCYALLVPEPRFRGDEHAPYIERDAVGGAYDMEITCRRIWYVSKAVARELIDRRWVGYTDRFHRQITNEGVKEWFRFCDACVDAIESFARSAA